MAKVMPSKKVGTTKAPPPKAVAQAKKVEYEEDIPGFNPDQAELRIFRPPCDDGTHRVKFLINDNDNPEPQSKEYETREGKMRRDFTVLFRAEITNPEDKDFGSIIRCRASTAPRKTGKKNQDGEPIYSSQVADLLAKFGRTPTGKSSNDAQELYEVIQEEPEIDLRTRWEARLQIGDNSSEADVERSYIAFRSGQSKFPQNDDGTFEPLREVPEDETIFVKRGDERKEFEFIKGELLWTNAVVVEYIPIKGE